MDNHPSADDELDPLYAEVFEYPKNGTPDNIAQAGCLALARLGKEAWNAWRRKYPARKTGRSSWENKADFSEFDFRKESIEFQGFVFGDEAHFDFAQFGDHALFNGAQFGSFANFDGTRFGGHANFYGAQFGDFTSFIGAQLNDGAIFTDAQFGDNTHFLGAQFGYVAQFSGAQFGKYALFNGAQFNDDALYHGAKFGEQANFCALTWEAMERCYSKRPGGLEAAKAWAEARGLSPKVFKSIIFSGVEFAGQVDFSGRAFEGITSFGRLNFPLSVQRCDPEGNVVKKDLLEGHPVVFGKAPLFHNCKLHQDTTFDGAKFPKPSTDPLKNDIAARAYRTLKLAFAQQQATREEQLFFRLEMAEEAARAKKSQRWLFVAYKWMSDYGFSLSLPTFWWLGFMLLFLLIYSLLAGLTLCLPWEANCQIRSYLFQFALLQSLPLPGLDKWSDGLRTDLFPKDGWNSVWIIVAVTIHKALSLLAVFLFGLALRNLFKMK